MKFTNFHEESNKETGATFYKVECDGKIVIMGEKVGDLKKGGPVIELTDEMKDILGTDTSSIATLSTDVSPYFTKKGMGVKFILG